MRTHSKITYVSDVCLKILHPKGPNHEPEFKGAKPPAQGDLPVLEQRNTVLVVRGKGTAPSCTLQLYHPLPSQTSRDRKRHHDSKAVAKEKLRQVIQRLPCHVTKSWWRWPIITLVQEQDKWKPSPWPWAKEKAFCFKRCFKHFISAWNSR